jgi:hypothetical protein
MADPEAAGKQTEKRVLIPGVLATSILPPWALTNC